MTRGCEPPGVGYLLCGCALSKEACRWMRPMRQVSGWLGLGGCIWRWCRGSRMQWRCRIEYGCSRAYACDAGTSWLRSRWLMALATRYMLLEHEGVMGGLLLEHEGVMRRPSASWWGAAVRNVGCFFVDD